MHMDNELRIVTVSIGENPEISEISETCFPRRHRIDLAVVERNRSLRESNRTHGQSEGARRRMNSPVGADLPIISLLAVLRAISLLSVVYDSGRRIERRAKRH